MNKNLPKDVSSSCVYCGGMADTMDHIPPKSLFQKPRPPLITVPACKRCNSEASLDDEYFRNALIIDHRIEKLQGTQQVREAFKRSVRRSEAPGLQNSLINNLRRVSLISPTGLYKGQGGALKFDFSRMSKVLIRIVKGLFFHELKRCLPSDCLITAHSPQEMVNDFGAINASVKLVKEIKKKVTLENDLFSYGFVVWEDQTNASFWMLQFYNTQVFFVSTTPAQFDEKISDHLH